MAVVTLFMSDRDPKTTFSDKKAADNYDKMLELAENVSLWMEKSIKGLSEEQVENIGMLIAENKELLSKAIKGKPESLLDSDQNTESKANDGAGKINEKVTKITA